MKRLSHSIIRKAAASLFLTAAGTLPMLAGEPETPQSIIHPEWEYTYYNDFFKSADGAEAIYQKCGFTEEKEIDGKTYWLFQMLYRTDRNGTIISDDPCAPMPMPVAYMREENGKVYMRLHPEASRITGDYGHHDLYGYKDRDLMVYDFNLKAGDAYQIGDPDTYPVYNPEPDAQDWMLYSWMFHQEYDVRNPYAYLMMWDDGRMSVADVKEDAASGRRVWFIHQKCTAPQGLEWFCPQSGLLDELDTDFDTTHTRTFRFVEGIGCLKSYLPCPGLYPPTFESGWMSRWALPSTPMLCEVKDKTTGEIIYKDERRPDKNVAVERIGAVGENEAPEYYTLQGIRVLNPEPGEICIVRRGSKVSKEVIAR